MQRTFLGTGLWSAIVILQHFQFLRETNAHVQTIYADAIVLPLSD
jgi:hypothetical protein